MRILLLDSEHSWRGGQNQTLILALGLKERGHSCHIAAPAESPLAKRAKDQIPVLGLERGPLHFVLNALSLVRYCRQHRIEIIDAQSARAHLLGLLARFFLANTKLFVHRRVDYAPSKNPFTKWRYFHKNVAGYIAISNTIADVLLRYGIRQEKIHVARSAASTLTSTHKNKASARAAVCKSLNISPSLPLIVTVAALTPQKDPFTLVESYQILKALGVEYHALIAGEGSLLTDTQALIHSFDLENYVQLLGFRDDVDDLLKAADLFVLSSQDEGLGTIILDAMQSETPVLATKAGGIVEMIKDGQTGFLVPARNASALAQKMAILIADQKLRNQVIEPARALVIKDFSQARMIEENIRIFSASLQGRTAS